MKDVLLVVDVLDDFAHEHGQELLSSFAKRHTQLVALLSAVRAQQIPVVYANDNRGIWDADADRIIRSAVNGPGGTIVSRVLPRTGERFVIKPRYSAFDHTPLGLILEELDCGRLLLAGMTTEGCVAQTAIAAREHGLKVSVAASACATTDPGKEETALRYLVDVVGVELDDTIGIRGFTAVDSGYLLATNEQGSGE
jgi:nicotinamidase-related amidase